MFFNIFRVRVEGSMRFVLFDKINVKKDLSKKKKQKIRLLYWNKHNKLTRVHIAETYRRIQE